ncbi:Tetratricopeptide repeat-containing protein [Rubritalea squalenifaciens DSM 18772]|uniref:Tetratricopeptide repeat-containing protein n=1 Tax=Rubritalea squalenifaciens DSM 18772 TaxID=1123071 RepID=A0A1M6M6E4_9BACT|nr:tetratricopeptide repeat protein [Rubritalea squalenifaciens]SHJ79024.1 Tetratricopeptide repeat-containing protein [Rubritalea squalenifaciens DSM 18772]
MNQARAFTLLSSAAAVCLISSCGNSPEEIRLADGTVSAAHAGTSAELYAEGYAYEQAGKTTKAIKHYESLANQYPLAKEAAEARYRQADLLYQTGDLVKSFKAFQDFITSYHGTRHYSDALAKQEAVAHSAATGELKHNFLGLKSSVAATTAEEMLIKVRDNAPYGASAPKAQFAIGDLWQRRGNEEKAIKAYQEVQLRYPKSSLAPEALFRAGTMLMNEADEGNQNQANLDQARSVFIDLRQLYPGSKQAKAAKSKLAQLGSQDLQRSYDIAEFYRGKKQYASAAFYYREVIKKTKSGTELNKLAKQRLAEVSQ